MSAPPHGGGPRDVRTPLEVLASVSEPAWLVGGALRDELLGRRTADADVVVDGDVRAVARALARRAGGHPFALSEAFGAWRVIARDHAWQVDLTPLANRALEQDLARRDLTVNAIARRLGTDELIDPFGGCEDLHARLLRMVGRTAFEDDPLRTLRLARLSGELEFEIERETLAAAAAAAPGLRRVAPERVFAEIRAIVCGPRPLDALRAMAAVGATTVVLPELSALHGVEQSVYHHLDVHDHTLEVLDRTLELEHDPGAVFGELAADLAALLAEPMANEMTRGEALRFGALLHDAAKPATRAVSDEGRVTFLGHDEAGAELVGEILGRLRASERLVTYVQALTRHHLTLGFLVREAPLTRRAVYRYLRDCEPVEVDVTLLSVADRLATRGRGSDVAIERHLELAREMMREALSWHAARPRPPIRGDQLARALGIEPGPRLGALLEELEEAAFAGELHGEQAAVALARRLVSQER
jgi:putative nucleotidyltransferase with HDIG domain